MIIRQLETLFVLGFAVGLRCTFTGFQWRAPVAHRVAEVRVVFLRQRHVAVRRRLRLANDHRHFEKIHAQRLQHAVHLRDARFTTFVQPMADAALGHANTLSELCLSDFEFTHFGLDQLNPFIHVRHLTRDAFGQQNTICRI